MKKKSGLKNKSLANKRKLYNNHKKLLAQKQIEEITKSIFVRRAVLFIRIFFLILLGFLPSFIFTFLFMQYGSPVSNYLRFISNFQSSWVAWVSAIAIVFFVLFIRKITKSKHRLQNLRKNKVLLFTVILCLVLLTLLIFLQSYLYLNFLLKNDILVKLSSDKSDIYFLDNPQEEVTFKISVTSNPFCSSECNYRFFDVSSGEEIDSNSFILNSIFSKFKNYTLQREDFVEGSQSIKRFEVTCKSKKTALCYTKEKESKRVSIITVNYILNESDLKLKQQSQEKIISIEQEFYLDNLILKHLNESILKANSSFSVNLFKVQYENLYPRFLALNYSLNETINLWEKQHFVPLLYKILQIKETSLAFFNEVNQSNSELSEEIKIYNLLVEELYNSRKILEGISMLNITNKDCLDLKDKIIGFNNGLNKFELEDNLFEKQNVSNNIHSGILNFNNSIISNSPASSLCVNVELLNQLNLLKINISQLNYSFSPTNLKDPESVCCFYGECQKCCENNKCSNENYPVLFLHGHSVNKKLPADYSLDVFSEIKDELIKGRYLDAGAIILDTVNNTRGLWGKLNVPVLITGSYFFSTSKIGDKEVTVSSTTESIDTYAIRLNDLVNLIKYKTNKEKVTLVVHSMGGLVTRRYIQLFGNKSVDKIILITVPNHGIEDRIKDYCGILGSEIACKEMDKNSIFMNQLNKEKNEGVLIYNIIGTGCNMGDETGDGVLKNSSQYLDYATNYYVQGSCDELSFNFLHETIMYPFQYPQVVQIINEIL